MRWEYHAAVTLVISGVVMLAPISDKGVVLAALAMGGVGIDLLDHGLYMLLAIRPLTVKQIMKVAWEKYHKMEPGFYFFHLWEVYGLCWLLLSKSYWGNWFLLAYTIHLLMDFYQYMKVLKNWRWMRYWTIAGWIK